MAQLRTLSRSLPPMQLLLTMFATALALTLSPIAVSWLFFGTKSKKVEEKQVSIAREERCDAEMDGKECVVLYAVIVFSPAAQN